MDDFVFSVNDLGFPQVYSPKYGFTVALDLDGSSRDAIGAIWRGQHQCVSSEYAGGLKAPKNAAEIVIKHQLKGGRGHYSVLDQAFFVFSVHGAPHESVAQLTRHHELKYLVQSGRYTGDHYIAISNGEADVRDYFYHNPIGEYKDRSGAKFEVTAEDLEVYYADCEKACDRYTYLVKERGWSYETARSCIPYGFRQDFQVSGRYRDWWHMLDQRTKLNAQLSTRVIANMVHELLLGEMPVLQQWYADHRMIKGMLAP